MPKTGTNTYQTGEWEQFRAILETAVDGIITIDGTGTVQSFNPAAEEIFGYDKSEVIGQNVKMLMPEPYRANHDGYLHNYKQSGDAKIIGVGREVEGQRKNGSTFPLHLSVGKMEVNGQPWYNGILRDITIPKRNERALVESEERFKLIISSIGAGIWEWFNVEQSRVYWSPQFFNMLGYEVDELPSSTDTFFNQLLHPEDVERTREVMSSHLASAERTPFCIEYRVKTKNQGYKWFQVNGMAGTSSITGVTRMVGSIIDIHDRKTFEEHLLTNERRFRNLVNNTPVMRHFTDAGDIIINVSHYWLEHTGYALEDVLGKPVTQFLTPESRHYMEHTITPELHADGRIYNRPLQLVKANGGIIDVMLSGTVERNEEGTFIQAMSVMFDVTERNQSEILLREYSARLAEQNDNLRRSNQELENFAYVASHDLQEPLRMVRSYCELLNDKYNGKLDADGQEFLDYVVHGAERMQLLIRDLLSYSRVSRNEITPTEVPLEQVVDDVRQQLAVQLHDAQATLKVEGPLPVVRAERSMMLQLVQNLVGNAVKFHKEGEKPQVTITAERRQNRWQVSVADNGIGIDERFKNKVFEMFKSLHPRDKYPGTGIGLAVCKKIVERHGGEIWLDSEPGHGTTFSFTLPATVDDTTPETINKIAM